MIRVMYLAIHKITMKFTFFHTRENTNNKEKFEFEMGVDSYVTYTVVQCSNKYRGFCTLINKTFWLSLLSR